jgi:hypothetical protein
LRVESLTGREVGKKFASSGNQRLGTPTRKTLAARRDIMDHPVSESCLERFAFGRSTPAENRFLVSHLLQGCSFCSRKLVTLMRPEISPAAYDTVFSRVEGSVADTWSALRREDFQVALAEAR